MDETVMRYLLKGTTAQLSCNKAQAPITTSASTSCRKRARHESTSDSLRVAEELAATDSLEDAEDPPFVPLDGILQEADFMQVKYHTIQPPEPGDQYVVKFARATTGYGISAHLAAAIAGHAPPIYGVWTLLGGWLAVLMGHVPHGDSHNSTGINWSAFVPSLATQAVRKAVVEAYCAAFSANGNVHGDLRADNILVGLEGDGSLALAPAPASASGSSASSAQVVFLDFDWAGHHGVARYPLVINHSLAWAAGVQAGGLISSQHDIDTICGRVFHR
jgi:hypothetical protein